MGNTLFQYYSTITSSNGGQNTWPAPADTMLYPTLITFGASLISLVLASIVLISYTQGIAKADEWEGTRETFEKCATALKITTSSAAAGSMFSTGNSTASGPQSLWRITCNASQEAKTLFHQFIDFDTFCLQQVHCFVLRYTDCRTWVPICILSRSFQRF